VLGKMGTARRVGVPQGNVRVRQGGAAFGKDTFVKAGGVRKGGWQSSRSQSSRRGDVGKEAIVRAARQSSRQRCCLQGNTDVVKAGQL
jgi:hypothetical protein